MLDAEPVLPVDEDPELALLVLDVGSPELLPLELEVPELLLALDVELPELDVPELLPLDVEPPELLPVAPALLDAVPGAPVPEELALLLEMPTAVTVESPQPARSAAPRRKV